MLDKKLQSLAQHANFQVSINSVVGTSDRVEDAVAVTRRARELGFATTVGVVHDRQGQLLPLGQSAQATYKEIMQTSPRSAYTFAYYNQFQKNLIEGKANEWDCRAGSRYVYICENGLVHYCSQQRGTPGIALEQYGASDLEREYHTVKSCAPYCTISCVHQVSMIDAFRDQPRNALGRFFPALGEGHRAPVAIRMLTWMFLPPEGSIVRKKLTQAITQVTLRLLNVS